LRADESFAGARDNAPSRAENRLFFDMSKASFRCRASSKQAAPELFFGLGHCCDNVVFSAEPTVAAARTYNVVTG
jgi:hypothetical protein